VQCSAVGKNKPCVHGLRRNCWSNGCDAALPAQRFNRGSPPPSGEQNRLRRWQRRHPQGCELRPSLNCLLNHNPWLEWDRRARAVVCPALSLSDSHSLVLRRFGGGKLCLALHFVTLLPHFGIGQMELNKTDIKQPILNLAPLSLFLTTKGGALRLILWKLHYSKNNSSKITSSYVRLFHG